VRGCKSPALCDRSLVTTRVALCSTVCSRNLTVHVSTSFSLCVNLRANWSEAPFEMNVQTWHIHIAYPRTVVWNKDRLPCILTLPANKFVRLSVWGFRKWDILTSFAFFEGFKSSPACPSDKSGIEIKMSIKHSWNNADRGAQYVENWRNGTDSGIRI